MTKARDLSQVPNASLGFKNRIINGDMRIDQRNAGASVTLAGGSYTLDRWSAGMSVASKFSVEQTVTGVTAPVGFTDYLAVTSVSSYSVGSSEVFVIRQLIEGFNIADFGWGTANAQPVTISFWVRSSLTGTFGGALNNSGNTRSYPFTYTISAANTWEYKTITVAGDTTGTWLTTNGNGITLNFSLGSGSTYSGTAGAWAGADYRSATGATSVVGTSGATFYITGVQLEKGSTATSFDYRPYTTELQLCQRYAFKTNSDDYIGQAFAGTVAGVIFPYPVIMRAAPTSTLITNGSLVNNGGAGLSVTGISANNNGTATGRVNLTIASGLVAGEATLYVSGSVLFSSEL